ncbi:MAG: DoxX family protein, partial [Acidimicrobiales bacterium]
MMQAQLGPTAFTVYVVMSVLFSLMLAYAVTLEFRRGEKLLEIMAKVHVPPSWLPSLAILKAAGAIGLLVGIAVPFIGVAGAIGLVFYFVGAIVAHLRARDSALGAAIFLAPAV